LAEACCNNFVLDGEDITTYPSVDESFARLHRAGWSIGEIGSASSWLVSGTNGENVIHAEGQSQAEAWYRAMLQAEAVGMLAAKKVADFTRF
jgi:hypothetical protein